MDWLPQRGYGCNRTSLDDRRDGAIWYGHGYLAYNLIKIRALASEPVTANWSRSPPAPIRSWASRRNLQREVTTQLVEWGR